MGVYFKEFRRGRILGSGLDTIPVTFWQRMYLLFVFVQKNLPETKLKSFRLMALAQRFQDSLVLTLFYGW